jgi:hypothetical protein
MEQGEVVDIYKTKAMNLEIQFTTELRFDLSMSTLITMTSLPDRLRFLSDREFAVQMLCGEVHSPLDVNATTFILEEIIHLFNMLHKGHTEITLGEKNSDTTGKEFGYPLQALQVSHPFHQDSKFSGTENNLDSKMRMSPRTLGPWTSGITQEDCKRCIGHQTPSNTSHGGQL